MIVSAQGDNYRLVMVSHAGCNDTNMNWLTTAIRNITCAGEMTILRGMKMEDTIERLRIANDLKCFGISQVLNGGGT